MIRKDTNKMGFSYSLILLLVIALSACSTSLVSYPPKTSTAVGEGIKYYLPMDVIEMASTKKTTTTNSIEFNPDGLLSSFSDPFACFKIGKTESSSISVEPINAVAVNDTSHYYSLSIDPDWMSAGNLILKRGSAGLLKEITISEDGRADEAALSLAKSVATIAGAATGIQSIPEVLSPPIQYRSGGRELLNQGREVQPGQPLVPLAQNNCSDWLVGVLTRISAPSKNPPAGDVTEAWERAVAELAARSFSELELLALYVNQSLINSIRRVEYLKSYVAIKQEEIDSLEGELGASTSENRGGILFRKRQIESDVSRKLVELDLLVKSVNSSFKTVSDQHGIGTSAVEVRKSHVFQLAELPDFETMQGWINSKPDCSAEDATWKIHFCELGAAIALEKASLSEGVPAYITAWAGSDLPNSQFSDKAAYIYYRDSTPYLYKQYIQQFSGTESNGFKESQTGLASLFSSSVAPSALKFEASSTSKRGLELEFSDRGMLIDVSYNYESDGEVIAQTLETGTNSVLNSYRSGLDEAGQINSSRRSLESSRLDYEISLLKSQKESIDAQVQLAGAQASASDIVLSAQLNQRILRLEAESSLLDAQLQSVDQRSQAIDQLEDLRLLNSPNLSNETSTQSGIRDQIQELELQLELIRLRQQLRLQDGILN